MSVAQQQSRPRVAVLDDEERLAAVMAMVLRRAGYDALSYGRPSELFATEMEGLDLLLTDLKMPEMDGVEVLAAAKARWSDLPVVVITAHGSVETAVAAMKQGAFDYLTKPIDNGLMLRVVERALTLTRLTRDNRYLRQQLAARYGTGGIIAASAAMQRVLDLVTRAARSRASALITGETGTGKEVIARAIHYHSDRVGGPFVAVNCKAFAPGVLESELFGHVQGAFTGADRVRRGVFEQAHGGTIFLDEIGEVSADFQAKLLRVVQEREIQRVGDDAPRAVDVRIVAATNRDLVAAVKARRFREDLYFRLAVVPIHLPPLRERPDDILPLARMFLQRMNDEQSRAIVGWNDEVADWLMAHPWPGNVRELENNLERGVVLARGDVIELSDLLVEPASAPSRADCTASLQAHLDMQAAVRIRQALVSNAGVRVAAARELGVERTTLYRLMKRYGID